MTERVASAVVAILLLAIPPEGGNYRNEKGGGNYRNENGGGSYRDENGGGSYRGEAFIEAAAATGLTFTHVNGATGQYYMPEQMGAGAALFDYDNAGDLDVFRVRGGSAFGKATAGPSSRLFRNDLTVGADGKRSLHFTDVTEQAGLALRNYGMGAAVGDYDNDGNLDLFVTGFGGTALYHNNGDGTFTDVTVKAGVTVTLWSTSAAFVDYDR